MLLVVTAIAIARVADLFAAVMLSGMYGLLSASFFVAMDAVDVAFTEAAVGAGIFPLLMLMVLQITGRYEKNECRTNKSETLKKAGMVILLAVAAGVLVYGTLDMPAFGSAEAPAQQHVNIRYIEQSPEEIGIPNMVTSVLASYRGYDTLGEVLVIFTAAMGVLALFSSQLFSSVTPSVRVNKNDMCDHHVLRIVSKILIPLILLFAFYVQFHGEYGPGGGFQAGVIFAAGIILYTMLYGLDKARDVMKPTVLRLLCAIGVFIYGSTGVVSMLSGGNFLDYSVLTSDAVVGQHVGILVIELGVGITIAAGMILIFFAFSQQAESQLGEQ
ncbi:Na(+)/H(+) antiporter subunit B [Neptunicella sp. SCSIO 80796]|uniref:Na(+)/H(+) antiporter subunit B n=1 Tax=Neptunicella plasticusilytica TaxID=3117012 RepID=UPI003A4D1E31